MKCAVCESRIPEGAEIDFCPFCASRIRGNEPKASFEMTWAMMNEDDLKRKPDQKKFDETWNWRKQDLVSHPENGWSAIEFLDRYPQFSADFSGIDPDFDQQHPRESLKQLAIHQADVNTLYRLGISHELSLNELQEIIQKRNLTEPRLAMLVNLLEGNYPQARAMLKKEFHLEPDQPLRLDTDRSSHLFAGIENDCARRMETINLAVESRDMESVLENLYRPLVGQENAFEHLNELNDTLIAYLTGCPERWEAITLETIEKDRCLRGIHLVLTALKNRCESAGSVCDKLLQKQYEKAYLRPFAQIENSDYLWD